MKIQLRWAGHVSRMGEDRLPKIAMYGELSSGYHNRGAPKKQYKDLLKRTLCVGNISHFEWSTHAKDRGTWRNTIHEIM